MSRPLRALATGTTGAAIAALSVWSHAAFVNGETLTRGVDPVAGLPATNTTLLIHIAFPALALIPILGVLAMLWGPWPVKAASALTFLAGWYWLADDLALRFAAHFGTTWRSAEPFAELFYRAPYTPILMLVSLIGYMLILSKIMR